MTNFTNKQRRALYALVFAQTPEEREPMVSHTSLTAKEWNLLEENGLVELAPGKSPAGRPVRVVRLSEEGWGTMDKSLSEPWGSGPQASRGKGKGKKQSPPRPTAERILANAIATLGNFLSVRGESLASFVAPNGSANMVAATGGSNGAGGAAGDSSLEDRIRSACLDIGGGTRTRVLLRDLRARLVDVPREQLDRALVQLQKQSALNLYPMDNSFAMTPDDERAALLVGGNPRHMVYLEG